MYLDDHQHQFPSVPNQPGFYYGGVKFSAVNDNAFADYTRPLSRYLPVFLTNDTDNIVWCCPADQGIRDVIPVVFRTYGNSYRANAALVNWSDEPAGDALTVSGTRGMHRHEITTAPSRLVLAGDAVWFEVAESTGRSADWHRERNAGNVLFLDGSVHFVTVKPKHIVGPVVFDPQMHGSAPVVSESGNADRVDLLTDDE